MLRLALAALLAARVGGQGAAAAPAAVEAANFYTISLQVDPRKEECVYEDVPAGASVEALIMIYRGGKLDLDFIVTSPSAREIYKKLIFSNINDANGRELPTIVKKGTTFVATEGGIHKFCFNNQLAKWTAKVLTFDLTVKPPGAAGVAAAGAAAGGDVVKAPSAGAATLIPENVLTTAAGSERSALQHLSSLRRFASRYLEALARTELDMQYHRLRSARHHSTLLSTEWRVSAWSTAESVTVLLCAALQVFLVRRWFDDGGEDKGAAGAPGGAASPLAGSFSARDSRERDSWGGGGGGGGGGGSLSARKGNV